MQIKIKYVLPIWWVNSFWFEDADIIDQLAILDLTGTDLIECMYGYTEMEALATYFDMDSESAGIYADFVLLWQQIPNSLEWTISVSRSQRQESFFNVYTCLQTVQHCCHTAFEHCRSWENFLSSCLNQNQPQSHKIYINNESYRCVEFDAKSWKCSAERHF